MDAASRLEPWGPGDRWLLTRLVGDPAMMEHLGGAESLAKIDERQARYEQPDSHCLKIVTAEGEACSWVGFWERAEPGAPGLEIGWAVAPEFQGRGLAQAGARLAVPCARVFTRECGHTGAAATVAASPSVANAPSKRICERLGFTDLGARDFEYPPGSTMRCREWRLDLLAE